MLAADVAAVSDGSLALDGEADARVGGALGVERENSLRREHLGILVAFIWKADKKRIGKMREKVQGWGFQLPSTLGTTHHTSKRPGQKVIGGLEGGENMLGIDY